MNEILLSVYGAILPSAPYVIAAYALIWLILFVYVAITVRAIKKKRTRYRWARRSSSHSSKRQELINFKIQTNTKRTLL